MMWGKRFGCGHASDVRCEQTGGILNRDRANARWAGVFYILATAAPILTVAFIGFLGGGVAGEPVADYLVQAAANEGQVIMGMFVEVIWALSVLFIPVMLFSILRKHSETLALGFLGLRFIEAVSAIIHSILLLSLLTLAREAAAAAGDVSYLQSAGSLLLAAREWTFMIGSGIVWSLSALLLNYLLIRSNLVPRWLSLWGLIGGALSLVAYLLQFVDVSISEWVFAPIAVQEMVFAVWLIVKGFNASALASQTGK